MQKVLITGGAGFVGRHFTKAFLDRGFEVHCVDSLVPLTGAIDPQKGWPLFNPYDYSNFIFYQEDCRNYFNRHTDSDYDYALHLAAVVGGRMMIEHNPLAVADDLSIDAAYWQWARSAKPKKSVCFSSSAAYPISYQRRDSFRLLKEEMISFPSDIGMPDMSYGWAKLTCEYLAKLAYEKHGLKSVVYRPFSGYGEDQDMAYPFPSIMKRAIEEGDGKRFVVWGSGEQMRDFIHISDCVDGVLSTMDKIDNASPLNLSTGIYTNFKELARMACGIVGYTPEVVGVSDKPEGVFARGGDTTKQKSLGFTHTIGLEEGVRTALNYIAAKV